MKMRLHRARWMGMAVALAVGSAGVSLAEFKPFPQPKLPPEVTYPSSKVVKVTDAGAVADGTTLCGDAIKKAIDECAAAGGGIVEFPKTGSAVYLTGAIHLKSNITLQVDDGVTLKFSADRSLYPLVKTRYECVDIMNYSPLIYAYQCENIRITGKGTLDGQGPEWWKWARNNARGIPQGTGDLPSKEGSNSGQGMGLDAAGRKLMLAYTNDREGKYSLEERVFGDKVQGCRPCFIEPYECKNVLIEGVSIKDSPFWNIHPLYSENVTIRGVTVYGDGPNTDGVDPDSCKTVLIENSTFNTGDDCVVIKSGRDGDGIRKNVTCEDLTIRNCVMNGGHGAITMGSETSAGIKRVWAENCIVNGPDSAIRLKTTRGRGGGIEDVFIKNVKIDKTNKFAITIDLMYSKTQPAPKSETTPVVRNIHIEDVTCDASPQALQVRGLEESPVENLSLKNLKLKGKKGATLEYVNGYQEENVEITAGSGPAWTKKDVK